MITDRPRTTTPARRPTASRATASRATPTRRSDRPGSFAAVAPPALGLVVASPAVLSALSGATGAVDAAVVVAVCVSAACVLSTVGLKVAGALAPPPGPTASPSGASAAATSVDPTAATGDAVALGRIEPVRIPASEAIAGTPPPPVPDMEGPLT